MSHSCHYDTVAFDVRENAAMLFFARTSKSGDIAEYLLIMRPDGTELADVIYLEVNESQFSGADLIRDASIAENMLTLSLNEPASELDGATEIVVTFDSSEENRSAMETGAFRVLGDKLSGGHA